MEIRKPIIIFGSGRSGTTVVHRMLSNHPEVAWLSESCNKYPNKVELNGWIMKALEHPILNSIIRKRINPSECYEFWEYYCKGFSLPCRDLFRIDVTKKSKSRIHNVMSKLITKKKHRLLLKITGWPRLGFLSEIFDDAKFIHVVRDGRAVANSLIEVGFWWGWRGPENWRWGPLSSEYREEWNKYNQSYIVLAAIQWKILMDACESAKRYIDESHLLEIKYEQLCSNPIDLFKAVAEFSELQWTDKFEKELNKYELKNTNYKWEQQLNDDQQRDLNDVLRGYLRKYRYLPDIRGIQH